MICRTQASRIPGSWRKQGKRGAHVGGVAQPQGQAPLDASKRGSGPPAAEARKRPNWRRLEGPPARNARLLGGRGRLRGRRGLMQCTRQQLRQEGRLAAAAASRGELGCRSTLRRWRRARRRTWGLQPSRLAAPQTAGGRAPATPPPPRYQCTGACMPPFRPTRSFKGENESTQETICRRKAAFGL
jgi:hypothetical protein